MSTLKNLKQSRKSTLRAILGVTGVALTAGAIYFHNKRIEELERKVDHIINDMEK